LAPWLLLLALTWTFHAPQLFAELSRQQSCARNPFSIIQESRGGQLSSGAVPAAGFANLCANRAAIERVYYDHRTGAKPPFEEALPRATLESLVRQDLKQEAVLRQRYGVAITTALLDAEVRRINTTTRAPEMLAEIQTALGHDAATFAEAFAKPVLVGRMLREKFENDDALHAAQRQEAERMRSQLLAAHPPDGSPASGESEIRNPNPDLPAPGEAEAGGNPKSQAQGLVSQEVLGNLAALMRAGHSNEVSQTTWQLTSRAGKADAPAVDELEIKRRFGPGAQIIASPAKAGKDRKYYLEDLPGALQNVLRAQLRRPGDVSAVIETPSGFLLYLAMEKTQTALTAMCLALPKRSYERWLEEQK
jgi:hypothetical protein